MLNDNVDCAPWLESSLTCRMGSSPPLQILTITAFPAIYMVWWARAHPTACVFNLLKNPLIANPIVGVVHEPPLQETTINSVIDRGANYV